MTKSATAVTVVAVASMRYYSLWFVLIANIVAATSSSSGPSPS